MRLSFVLFVAVCQAASPASSPEAQKGLRLIAFNESYKVWMSLPEIDVLSAIEHNFIDVTEFDDSLVSFKLPLPDRIPSAPRQQAAVYAAVARLCQVDCVQTAWETTTALAAYNNRYYTAQTGRDAVLWLRDQYVAASAGRSYVTVELFNHPAYIQPSIIVRVIGTLYPNEVVILGGHIDSTGPGMPTGRAPGFDDDASGSSTVFAAFKTLMEQNWRPDRTVEFHAYAAEEVGLRGSGEVASAYNDRRVDVVSMTQFDMVCFAGRQNQRLVGLTSDFTHATLTSFIAQLIRTYTNPTLMGSEPSVCGYGCSDHASWTRFNYPAAFPFEARFGSHNPNIHTTSDTAAQCDSRYMGEFGKIALAFAIELGSSAP